MANFGDDPASVLILKQQLSDLESVILNMEAKRGRIFTDWLKVQTNYLNWEVGFNPSKYKRYNRGEIVQAHLGFNPGSEIGGVHYGVVMDNNEKSNPIVNIVPLGSLDPGQTMNVLHKDEIYLGFIPGMTLKESYAIPNQFHPISKLRILRPKFAKDKVCRLTSDQLTLIDLKLVQLFTKFDSRLFASAESEAATGLDEIKSK